MQKSRETWRTQQRKSKTHLTNALGKITVPEDAQPELDHIAAIAAALKAAATGLCVEGFTWSAEPAASGSAVAR
jgi:hypothetical protein